MNQPLLFSWKVHKICRGDWTMLQKWKLILSCLGFAVLVFDSKTAFQGAADGINLCLQTIIPSLFPFLFLSIIFIRGIAGQCPTFMKRIGRALGMPEGSEGFLFVGILGGYPSGAVCIAESYRCGQIKKDQAEHLLGFCNNAGPAFIFGMAGSLFSVQAAWALWIIHILSALLASLLLPKYDTSATSVKVECSSSSANALVYAIRNTAKICGWVVLFRIFIGFSEKWFLWTFPEAIQCIFYGLLELSNGICSLPCIESLPLRFLFFSAFLSIGGICILVQTKTAAEPLSLRWYLVGKLLQCFFSVIFSILLCPVLFPMSVPWIKAKSSIGLLVVTGFIVVFLIKKTVAFPSSIVYNKGK